MADSIYMRRCLQLARYGESYVSPNPMVGAVIVHNDMVIGEGYHIRYGQPHAEPNSINSVQNKSLLEQSTLYVNLEPCSHYGKTPPCTDLIIQSKIPEVVIGMEDPNPKVAGSGIKKLREAGISVSVGILENECRELNKRFVAFFEKKRPYIILKWAQTKDGFIDIERKSAAEPCLKMSNDITKILAHKLRAENQAILIGTNTALLDNPSLTVRNFTGKNPIRLIIDKDGKVPSNCNIFNTDSKTVFFTEKTGRISNEHVEYEIVNFDGNLVQTIIQSLYEKNINSVLVEGGSNLLQQFIDKKLWDEIYVETAPFVLEKGVKAPVIGRLPNSCKTYNSHQIYKYKNENSI